MSDSCVTIEISTKAAINLEISIVEFGSRPKKKVKMFHHV